MDLESEKLIVELNFRNRIIDERNRREPFRSSQMFDLLPSTILDKRTLQMIELPDLFKALDHTRTMVGSAKLFHSLMNPCESIELIHAKQDSFCELASNDRLRRGIESYLDEFAAGEEALFKLLNAHLHPLLPYGDFRRAIRTVENMHLSAKKLPPPETVYLDSLIKTILSFSGSPVSSLVSGPAFRTLGGIKNRKEKGFWAPGLRFRPGRLSGGSLLPALPSVISGGAGVFGFINPALAESLVFLTCGGILLGTLYALVLKPFGDYETAILPIRQRIYESNRFASAIEAVAAIDELVSFVEYSRIIPHPTVLPEVTNHESHSFMAKDLRNPIKAKGDRNFVGNDVELTENRVTFVTGPNSGGKTTYCKTIVQNQMLGQIGAPVVASAARLNMADKIAYQAPVFDSLNDPEGRFGTELKLTRDIFFSVTPKSLAILDEIAEGTTTHEKMSFSVEIMNGFHNIGNTTLLVTHSYELVDAFRKQSVGQYLQVAFEDRRPTHKLIQGISRDSHALRVAEKIGFAPEDMDKYLREKGYRTTESATGAPHAKTAGR